MASLVVILHPLIYFIKFTKEYKKNEGKIKKTQTTQLCFWLGEKNTSQFQILKKIFLQKNPKKPRLAFLQQGCTHGSKVFSAFHSQIKLHLIHQLPSCCHGDTLKALSKSFQWSLMQVKFSCMQLCTQTQGVAAAMGPAICLAHLLALWEGTKKSRTQSQSDMFWYLAIQASV